MARIRSIKPTFWSDDKIGLLSRDVRYTFLGLISAMADDEGRLVGKARIVRGGVYPYDDDVTVADIESHLAQLEGAGRIVRYAVAGSDYIQITNWKRHQKIDKPANSLLPAPPESFDDRSANVPRSFPTDRRGEEGNGEGRDDDDAGARGAPVAADAVPPVSPAPAVAEPDPSPPTDHPIAGHIGGPVADLAMWLAIEANKAMGARYPAFRQFRHDEAAETAEIWATAGVPVEFMRAEVPRMVAHAKTKPHSPNYFRNGVLESWSLAQQAEAARHTLPVAGVPVRRGATLSPGEATRRNALIALRGLGA